MCSMATSTNNNDNKRRNSSTHSSVGSRVGSFGCQMGERGRPVGRRRVMGEAASRRHRPGQLNPECNSAIGSGLGIRTLYLYI